MQWQLQSQVRQHAGATHGQSPHLGKLPGLLRMCLQAGLCQPMHRRGSPNPCQPLLALLLRD